MSDIYLFGCNTSKFDCPDSAVTKDHLGGKGWGLVHMSKSGLPVPPGVIISTSYHRAYMMAPPEAKQGFLDKLVAEVFGAMTHLPTLGKSPSLLSVRSGAPISMPGMMDTILNVGLTRVNLPEYAALLGERAALDSYRRLIQMLGSTAFEVPHEDFEDLLKQTKATAKVEHDHELDIKALKTLVTKYEALFEEKVETSFPDNRMKQVAQSIKTVFDSWDLPRAKSYRKINGIADDLGTAVVVQTMVFGNLNDESGTGVFFTRDPNTGANEIYGEFLPNAQGEDVVAGIRTPYKMEKLVTMPKPWPEVSATLLSVAEKLEDYYQDMVDCEFTVQQGVVYILQSRTGKRTAQAALKIAVDLIKEGVIKGADLKTRVTREQYLACRVDSVDPAFKEKPVVTGIAACSGAISGKIVLTSEAAVASTVPCILVTQETTPDDIEGMNAAVGILTATGGTTSHAAVVARAMNKPCVVGCTNISFQGVGGVTLGDLVLLEGDTITIDGANGNVWGHGKVPLLSLKDEPFIKDFERCMVELSGGWHLASSEAYDQNVNQWFSRVAFETPMQMALAIEASNMSGPRLMIDLRGVTSLHTTEDAFFSKAMVQSDHEDGPDYVEEFFALAAEHIHPDRLKDAGMLPCVGQKKTKASQTLGLKLMAEAHTVDDLVTGVGTYMTPATIKKVFGDEKVMDKVLKNLKVSMVYLPDGPQTVTGLVLQALK